MFCVEQTKKGRVFLLFFLLGFTRLIMGEVYYSSNFLAPQFRRGSLGDKKKKTVFPLL